LKAVMYGAGNIGRGFIGKVFSESGYSVCFIDIAKSVVDILNEENEYPVKIVSNEKTEEVIVKNVYAVNGMDTSAVADEILNADIMATAVGVNVLPKIIKPICEGLKRRFEENRPLLNIIICENLIDADKYLLKLIEEEMGSGYTFWLNKNLGLVEASIGRMVPVMTEKMKEGSPLKIWVEPYDKLPVDKDAFKGDIPKLNGLVPFSPFGFYIERKLYIHNMGHAMCAYFGYQKGYEFIDQAIADKEIYVLVKAAMEDSAKALNAKYSIPLEEIMDNVEDLLFSFQNKVLGDTVKRVGRDPLRKLKKGDRLMGAALACEKQGINPENIVKGIIAALKYDNPNDEAALSLKQEIEKIGIEKTVQEICGIDNSYRFYGDIIEGYKG